MYTVIIVRYCFNYPWYILMKNIQAKKGTVQKYYGLIQQNWIELDSKSNDFAGVAAV